MNISKEIKDILSELTHEGYCEITEQIKDDMKYGSTGTEILMTARSHFLEASRNKKIKKPLRKKIKELCKKIKIIVNP
jgi:hypothetical protein